MVHRNINDMEAELANTPASKPPVAKAAKPVAATPIATKAVPVQPVAKPVAVKPATVVLPVAPEATAVPPFADKPVVKAPDIAAQIAAAPVPVTPPATPEIVAPKIVAPKIMEAAPAPVIAEGKTIMNETITKVQETATNFANQTAERTTAAMGDMNVRAKDAMAKGTKAVEDMVEFSKGNLEALVASGRVAAKGTEEIAKYAADYGRKTIEDANANAKRFAAVKSPTEFFQLQGEVAKTSLDALVGEASKFTENYLKLLGEIAQPMQNRYAVAADKVKSVVAA